MNGSLELLIAYDEDSGMDAGYALVATKNLYGYVLLKYLAVMPWCRGQGLGIQIMRLINKRYADKQGIIAELTEWVPGSASPDRLDALVHAVTRLSQRPTRAASVSRHARRRLVG